MKAWLLSMAFLLCVLLATSLMGDSWAPPGVESYLSADGTWKLTVYPRRLTSQLGYFQDKVDGKSNAGGLPGDTQKSPKGHMERLQNERWRTAWKSSLVNDVSPVNAVVSNDGVSVTFDNWHTVGWGDDVVAIYADDGTKVRTAGLSDFLPKYYIDALPRSVSSIHWRGEPRIDETKQQLVIPVVAPTVDQQESNRGKPVHVEVRFRLVDGSIVPPAGKAWTDALASAAKADVRRKELLAEERERFISPLLPPSNGDVRGWYDYLIDAYFRIDPDWEEGYPATEVVPLRNDPKFQLLSGYLGEALSDDLHEDGVLMLASPSQDVLTDVIEHKDKEATPGFLAKARIYVAAEDAHMPAIRAALARTGAKVIQLDINSSIPQRKERLERYLQNAKSSTDRTGMVDEK